MTDPLADIEERKGQQDVGAMIVRVYQGAIAESEHRDEAFWATVAWMVAMLTARPQDSE